jgi:hypothetical protein
VLEETFPIHTQGPPPPTPSDIDRVLAWRIFQLAYAGYGDDEAVILGCAESVDLHEALSLRAHGCPTATALRILL